MLSSRPLPYPPRGLGPAGFYTGVGSLAPPGIIDFAPTVCQKSILEPPGSLWELIFNLRELLFNLQELPGTSGSYSNSFYNQQTVQNNRV